MQLATYMMISRRYRNFWKVRIRDLSDPDRAKDPFWLAERIWSPALLRRTTLCRRPTGSGFVVRASAESDQ
ncbi:hypothetical protein BQ8482_110350 [Mesorhizobium delmotii]|uniref:Uncharacterized protein n=1 Tax=Mesorhizobium delmotii TaxID=1631247 RepID=A0A2P9ABE9_9HYPH|nr:hypothetical protein BQ8482_110350 [Mesorhizobium delmotii]